MRIRDPLDIRVWQKVVLVNGRSVNDLGLKVFALKTGAKGFVDCYHQPYRLAKDGESIAKYRIRANVEVIS
jgi:hypothetical protein